MEIKIDIEELRKRKIFVATPMYGGNCTGLYTKATADLAKLSMHYGVECEFYYLFNESLITRARNYCADEFLRNKQFTHLMFIDSDIGFNAHDIFALAAIAEPGSDKDIICGPYPKKTIAWEKIKLAVDKGFADENPHNLQKFVGDYVFNPAQGQTEISLSQPAEVLEGGTGFMMIQRSAFEKFEAAYPEKRYLPDHARSAHFDGAREIMAYFDCPVDDVYTAAAKKLFDVLNSDVTLATKHKKLKDVVSFYEDNKEKFSRRYLSEDYMFCQYARNAGLKVWMCPWMQMQHVGTYSFGGSLVDLANVGAAATADPSQKLK